MQAKTANCFMLNGLIFGGRCGRAPALHTAAASAHERSGRQTRGHVLPASACSCVPASAVASHPHSYNHLCSVLLLDYVFKPALHLGLSAVVGPASAAAISGALVGLYHVLWLFPAYLISFLVNCIWWVPGCRRRH